MNFRPVTITFEGDWAGTWGYNVDHHISGYEADGIHRYTMDSTSGGAFHLSLTAETPLGKRFFFGLQADHTEIRTTGLAPLGRDRRQHGRRNLEQRRLGHVRSGISLTAYLRARF